jgi:hypothetical protein
MLMSSAPPQARPKPDTTREAQLINAS